MFFHHFPNKIWRPLLNALTPGHARSYREFSAKNWLLRQLRVTIGRDVAVGRKFDFFIGQGRLAIDHHINISNDVSIYAFKEISIGPFTAIGSHCLLTDGSHDLSTHVPKASGMKIGRGVFVGSAVKIVGSVTIGDKALLRRAPLSSRTFRKEWSWQAIPRNKSAGAPWPRRRSSAARCSMCYLFA